MESGHVWTHECMKLTVREVWDGFSPSDPGINFVWEITQLHDEIPSGNPTKITIHWLYFLRIPRKWHAWNYKDDRLVLHAILKSYNQYNNYVIVYK